MNLTLPGVLGQGGEENLIVIRQHASQIGYRFFEHFKPAQQRKESYPLK